MKLLELVEASATGVGRHVAELAEGLLNRGHEVHLLYSERRCDRVFARDVLRLSGRVGFRAIPVSMRREPSLSDLYSIRSVRRYMKDNGPFDLIHCHSTKAGIIGRAGFPGHPVKRIYTPHCFFAMNRTNSALTRRVGCVLEAILSRLCDKIIVVSGQEEAHAISLGISPTKLCLIHNGVPVAEPMLTPVERAALRLGWGLKSADICIGFVGRFTPVKSPETMLRSFAALLASNISLPARLIMIGDGPLEDSLRRLATELKIQSSVSWLGARDARFLMGAFDILALTSESEGHPLVVLEAMARGLPIVTTSVGGIRETVQHGVNGFIAPISGVSEIAAALEILVNDPALRGRMGKSSLSMSKSFSVDRMVDQTIALYEQVIGCTHAATGAHDLKVIALG